MSATPHETGPWVLAAVDALNRNGSWTGRVHIHKHLFITQVLELAAPPFGFVLYDYGPYSFELDDKIIELEMFGLLNRSYPQPGYGPRYEATAQGLARAAGLPDSERAAIGNVAERLGKRKSQELELIATCLWVEQIEHLTGDDDIVRRVQAIKPQFAEQARRGLQDARGLVAALSL